MEGLFQEKSLGTGDDEPYNRESDSEVTYAAIFKQCPVYSKDIVFKNQAEKSPYQGDINNYLYPVEKKSARPHIIF